MHSRLNLIMFVLEEDPAYPSLEEQLDALYHDIDNSDTLKELQFPTFHRAIKDVKLSIAKSTETINKYTDSNDTDYTSLY